MYSSVINNRLGNSFETPWLPGSNGDLFVYGLINGLHLDGRLGAGIGSRGLTNRVLERLDGNKCPDRSMEA